MGYNGMFLPWYCLLCGSQEEKNFAELHTKIDTRASRSAAGGILVFQGKISCTEDV